MINEDFDSWNNFKKLINKKDCHNLFFHEREVWWCSVGLNVGSESFGKGKFFRRPILIIKKLSSELCIALPITSKPKKGTWFSEIEVDKKKRWVMLYQIRVINSKRFQFKIGKINNNEFKDVKTKLKQLLEFC